MSTEMQTKVQASPAQSFTPAQTGLLQRKSALCNTPGLVEDSGRDKEKLTLQRSLVDQAGTTTVPRFGHDFSRVSVHSNGPGMIQTKLKINEPGDIYEQEADRVADAVMRMPEPEVQREVEPEEEEEEKIQAKPLAGQITPLVQRQPDPVEEEEENVQTQQIRRHGSAISPDFQRHFKSLKGGGQPLPESVRSFFESRFGYNFNQVRVHRDSRAANLARSINARAFTIGSDIVFGSGEYSPETGGRRRMLAHELAHTIQQKNTQTIQRNPAPTPPAAKIDRLFGRQIGWLTHKMNLWADYAMDSLKIAHGAFNWGKAIAEYVILSLSAGLGVLIGGGVGSKIFLAVLLSTTSSMLQSSVKTTSLNFALFKAIVKNFITDYLMAKNGVLARLEKANAKDKNELQKVVALLDVKKTPQIKKLSQEIAMSVFLASAKGILFINYRAVAPDLSRWSGNLSKTALKWYTGRSPHIKFHITALTSYWAWKKYTKGMTYFEGVYTGRKVKDANIPKIRVNVALRFPVSVWKLASKDYYHCAKHFKKGAYIKGCRLTGHTVHYSFWYFNGQIYTCLRGLCNRVSTAKQSVVDKNDIWPDSWYNYDYKLDVADKAIKSALKETFPKPRKF